VSNGRDERNRIELRGNDGRKKNGVNKSVATRRKKRRSLTWQVCTASHVQLLR